MYTKKPKDMTKFLVNLTSQDTFHTWQSDDTARQARVGAANATGISIAERKLKEVRRGTVGSYQASHIANSAIQSKREITSFTRQEREKLNQRLEKNDTTQQSVGLTHQTSPLHERPVPTASLYRRPGI